MLACERRVGREFPVTATANTQAMIGRRRRAPQTVDVYLVVTASCSCSSSSYFSTSCSYSSSHYYYFYSPRSFRRPPLTLPVRRCFPSPFLYSTTYLATTTVTARHSFLCVVVHTVTGRQRRYSCCTAI